MEYLMPYGLSCTPSVFQNLINDTLGKFVFAYVDDILIYSLNKNLHITHVKKVLSRLLCHQLYGKGEKCEFHMCQVTILGYVINATGVMMNKEKVSAVTTWPQPSSVKEFQRFLGFTNFYQCFVRGFSTIAALTTLLKWTFRN